MIAKGTCVFQGTTGTDIIYAQIDETAGGGLTPPYHVSVGANGFAGASGTFIPLSLTRVHSKPAGTYTFRIEAKSARSDTGKASIAFPSLTAMYFPTSYGSVNAFASANKADDFQLPRAAAISDRTNGTEGSSRRGDPRELEVRVANVEAEAASLRRQLLKEETKQSKDKGSK